MLKNKKDNINTIIEQLKSYCSIQDRCINDIIKKMKKNNILEKNYDVILKKLSTEKYLDEERFSKSFCRGKFRINKWGRIKIIYELKKRNISEIFISNGLREIDEKDYLNELEKQYIKYKAKIKEENHFKKTKKIASFLINKGYESNLVWERLRK